MFLVVTKYGGIYLCKNYDRNNGWHVLKQAILIRRNKRLSTYRSVEVRSKYIAFIEQKSFVISDPCETYNKIVDYINSRNERFAIKKELTKIGG